MSQFVSETAVNSLLFQVLQVFQVIWIFQVRQVFQALNGSSFGLMVS